jgi:hypothetical protein
MVLPCRWRRQTALGEKWKHSSNSLNGVSGEAENELALVKQPTASEKQITNPRFYEWIRPYFLHNRVTVTVGTAFRVAWCIYLSVTYLIIRMDTRVEPERAYAHIERYGVVLAVLRILLAAVLLTLVHMLLVYGILYFILPRYFSRNSKPARHYGTASLACMHGGHH